MGPQHSRRAISRVTTISGRLTTFGLFPEDKKAVDDAIREALAA